MMDFTEGSTCWFLFTGYSKTWSDDGPERIIFIKDLEILSGKIVSICPDKDYIHVYISGDTLLVSFGYCFHHEYFYHTREEAVQALKNKVEELILK